MSLTYNFLDFHVENTIYDGQNWSFNIALNQNNQPVPDDFIAKSIINKTYPLRVVVIQDTDDNYVNECFIEINSNAEISVQPSKVLTFYLQAKIRQRYISLLQRNFHLQYKPTAPRMRIIDPPSYQNELLTAIKQNIEKFPTMQYISTSQDGNDPENIFLQINCGQFSYLTYQKASKTPVQYGQRVCFYQLDSDNYDLKSDPLEVYQKVPIELIYQSNKNAIQQLSNHINNTFMIVIIVCVLLSVLFLIVSLVIIIKTFCHKQKPGNSITQFSQQSHMATFKTPNKTEKLKDGGLSYILHTKQ